MAQNIIEKILRAHLRAGEFVKGKEIGIKKGIAYVLIANLRLWGLRK